jgi:shikimate dehydrogenase
VGTLTLDEVAAWDGPPLVLFVGVDTAGSLAHTVFGRWAGLLDRPWVLRGVDLPQDTPPETYRRLATAVRDNQAVHGAVVTAHKLRLYRACAGDLRPDRLAVLTREVNALAAADGVLRGYANDARSLGHVLPDVPHVVCLGAGGAGTALLLALRAGCDAVFADPDQRALDDLRAVADRAGLGPVRYARLSGPADADALVAAVRDPALVVNATGLGKDAPGSPVSDAAPFRPGMLAWDFNYRGELAFLRQAGAHGASTMDGWDYFVAGWAGCLTAIAGVPFTPERLARFARAAAPHRPRAF